MLTHEQGGQELGQGQGQEKMIGFAALAISVHTEREAYDVHILRLHPPSPTLAVTQTSGKIGRAHV